MQNFKEITIFRVLLQNLEKCEHWKNLTEIKAQFYRNDYLEGNFPKSKKSKHWKNFRKLLKHFWKFIKAQFLKKLLSLG